MDAVLGGQASAAEAGQSLRHPREARPAETRTNPRGPQNDDQLLQMTTAERPVVRLQRSAGNNAVSSLLTAPRAVRDPDTIQCTGDAGALPFAQRQVVEDTPKVPAVDPSKRDNRAILLAKAKQLKDEIELQTAAFEMLSGAHDLTISRQNSILPGAGSRVHMALAYLLILHNPGASMKSFDQDVVAVDVRNVPKLATAVYDYPLSMTGAGTVWFVNLSIERDESTTRGNGGQRYREFMIAKASVPDSEVKAVLDPWYLRLVKQMDTSLEKGPPWWVEVIAKMNPLTGVAGLMELLSTGKVLFTGEEGTTADYVEAGLSVLGGIEGVFGAFIKSEAAKALLKGVPGVTGDLLATFLTANKALQEMYGQVIATAIEMVASGEREALDEVLKEAQTKSSNPKPK